MATFQMDTIFYSTLKNLNKMRPKFIYSIKQIEINDNII